MSPTEGTSAEEALTRLFQLLFDVNALRRFLRSHEDTRDVADHIPGESAPLAHVAFSTAEELLRRGLAGRNLFARLVREFPHQREAVDEVRHRLGVEALPHQDDASPAMAAPPRMAARPRSTTPDRQVVDTFAELYPSPQEARGIWQRAGGRIGDVPHNERPRTMWWELWRHSLLGGPARPEALLSEAHQDAPDNQVLRQALNDLTRRPEQAVTLVGQGPEGAVLGEVESKDSGKEVFVSYAWGGESEQVVDALQKAFADRDVTFVREKNELAYKDSIKAFMQRLGRSRYVVIVLSEKYLKSRNCMFELTEIASYEGFRSRVFPIVLPDAGIFDMLRFLDYVKYWEDRIKALDAKMKEVELSNIESIQDELNLYRRIRATMDGLTDVLRDMNARTVESHLSSGFREVLAAIEKKLGL